MNEESLFKAKSALDEELKGKKPRTAVAFGAELFQEFRRRGWITLDKFDLEPFGFKDPMPTYDSTHYAFLNWGLPDYEYRVGSDKS